MIAVTFKEAGKEPLLELLNERSQKRIYKNALRETLHFWYVKILPKHFGAMQYILYPDAFQKQKKVGQSMVSTGRFRDSVLLNEPKIRATYKGASLKIPFGRPLGAFDKAKQNEYLQDIKAMNIKTKKRVFSYMRGKKIKFADAQKELSAKQFSKFTYSQRTQKIFKRGLSAMSASDSQEVAGFMLVAVSSQLNDKKNQLASVK